MNLISKIPIDFSMTNGEILKCNEYVEGVDKMLEWGAGGSTLFFSSMVGKFVSIEDNREWYDKVKRHAKPNTEIYHVLTHKEKFDSELDENASVILHGDESWNSEHGGQLYYKDDGKILYWTTRGRMDWHCYMDYIKYPLEKLSYRDYDVILVDGRVRAMCAYNALHLLKKDGYLLIHDFNHRGYYHGILKWYNVIDTEGSLAVLTKK